ncbi:UNVERIFIED_CONTAM: hypothetical protein FKN15_030392 [Acipenser sinensis]
MKRHGLNRKPYGSKTNVLPFSYRASSAVERRAQAEFRPLEDVQDTLVHPGIEPTCVNVAKSMCPLLFWIPADIRGVKAMETGHSVSEESGCVIATNRHSVRFVGTDQIPIEMNGVVPSAIRNLYILESVGEMRDEVKNPRTTNADENNEL